MAIQDVSQAISNVSVDDLSALAEKAQIVGMEFGLNIITALAIYFIGKMVVGIVVRALRKLMQKNNVDITLETFIGNLVRVSLLVVVIIAAVGALGIQTTSLIAVMGAAGLAIGLALQGSLSNFAAGVLIVLFRPYKVGDYVDAAGVAGSIEEVQILTTIMKTPDNKRIIVPNSQIMSSIITNFSANETRRVDFVFGVGYGDDLDQVHKELRALVEADERILKEPAYQIVVSELADSSVNFTVRVWAKSGDYWDIYFDMLENVKRRFDDVGISIPFPQRDVHVHQVASSS